MPIFVKDQGAWLPQLSDMATKYDGAWLYVNQIWVKIDGSWVRMFEGWRADQSSNITVGEQFGLAGFLRLPNTIVPDIGSLATPEALNVPRDNEVTGIIQALQFHNGNTEATTSLELYTVAKTGDAGTHLREKDLGHVGYISNDGEKRVLQQSEMVYAAPYGDPAPGEVTIRQWSYAFPEVVPVGDIKTQANWPELHKTFEDSLNPSIFSTRWTL